MDQTKSATPSGPKEGNPVNIFPEKPEPREKSFYDLDHFPKTKFASYYQDTNIFSRFIYTYALETVQEFRKKCKQTIDMENIIDMNIETDEAKI